MPVEIDYSSQYGLFSHEIHFGWQTPSQSGIPAAVAAARKADVAVVFANDAQGEGMDRTSLDLQGDQDQLIEAVAHANRDTIVVLNTGGPVLMPWLDDVQGVLETWYPGQTFGTAIAAVLFGDANPGGRLPVTFPASNTQGPAAANPPNTYPGDANGNESYTEGLDVGYRWYDATGQRPLFPFGYGLSYEQFDVSGVHAFYDPVQRHRLRGRSRQEHLAASRADDRRAVPRVAGGRAGTAQAAEGLHEPRPRSRAEPVRVVPADPERPRVLQHRTGQVHGRPGPLHGAGRDVLDRARQPRQLRRRAFPANNAEPQARPPTVR